MVWPVVTRYATLIALAAGSPASRPLPGTYLAVAAGLIWDLVLRQPPEVYARSGSAPTPPPDGPHQTPPPPASSDSPRKNPVTAQPPVIATRAEPGDGGPLAELVAVAFHDLGPARVADRRPAGTPPHDARYFR
jgi:hypothetical protein